MQNLKSRLPPMDPLVTFEAAARHLSFTRAAQELNLSQAAVSQQIRNLESRLQTTLFLRSHRSVKLTSAGKDYLHTVSAVLIQLAVATDILKQPQRKPRLTLSADQSIASMWLMKRLPDFQKEYPETVVRLIASDDEQDCLDSDVQVAIIHGDGHWPGFESELLFEEEVFAVCSPDYLRLSKSNRSGLSIEVVGAEQLIDETLLELEDEHWNWMNWHRWFLSQGVNLPIEHRGLRINSYPLLIEAAKNGQGIALGWRHLVDDWLKDGSLVCPVQNTVKSDFGYYLVWPDKAGQSKVASEFRRWAVAQLRKSESD